VVAKLAILLLSLK